MQSLPTPNMGTSTEANTLTQHIYYREEKKLVASQQHIQHTYIQNLNVIDNIWRERDIYRCCSIQFIAYHRSFNCLSNGVLECFDQENGDDLQGAWEISETAPWPQFVHLELDVTEYGGSPNSYIHQTFPMKLYVHILHMAATLHINHHQPNLAFCMQPPVYNHSPTQITQVLVSSTLTLHSIYANKNSNHLLASAWCFSESQNKLKKITENRQLSY